MRAKVQPFIANFLKETNPETIIATAGLLANLNITTANDALAKMYNESNNSKIKTALLPALDQLKYSGIESIIKSGMEDKEENVRTTALSLLNNSNVSKASLPAIINAIFTKGGIKEQQQIMVVLGKLDLEKTQSILDDLITQTRDKKLPPNLSLELKEAVDASGSASLKSKLATVLKERTTNANSAMEEYAETLYGGNWREGKNVFTYNSAAQCMRCHAVRGEGGAVGPPLTTIGSTLSREQILQAMIEPSARIAPGYGTVILKLKGGQEVVGVLTKESDTELTITTSDAEPLVIAVGRIEKRENIPSSMPLMGAVLSKRELRDIVEYLAGLKK